MIKSLRRLTELADEEAVSVAKERALAEHAAAEQREAKRIDATGKALIASREKLAAAIKVADLALAEAFDAARRHDQLVTKSAAELLASGLATEWREGDEVAGFDTGGTPAAGLRLAGTTWTRVDPGAILYRVLFGAVRAKLGEKAAAPLRYANGVEHLSRHSGDLLADAPLPQAFVPPVPAWKTTQAEARSKGRMSYPEPDQDDQRRDRVQEQANTATRRRDYLATRAQMVTELGEARVRELEAIQFPDGQPFGSSAA